MTESLELDRPTGVCVFAGSNLGKNAIYANTARQLGFEIAKRGWRLIFGGGGFGLMGELAQGVLSHKGRVMGVIPDYMVKKEWSHPDVSDMRIVKTMHSRKQMMHDFSDAFIALPGGIGTLDELCEALSWQKLEIHRKPVLVLNVNGFFDQFITCLQRSVDDGFYLAEDLERLMVASSAEEACDMLNLKSSSV